MATKGKEKGTVILCSVLTAALLIGAVFVSVNAISNNKNMKGIKADIESTLPAITEEYLNSYVSENGNILTGSP